jgi:hypothetical protein
MQLDFHAWSGCENPVTGLRPVQARQLRHPSPRWTSQDQQIEGALVQPETGVYMEDPIVVLDFSSLYPSSIIATNMSHDTMSPWRRRTMYGRGFGTKTNDVTFDEENEYGVKVPKTVRFERLRSSASFPHPTVPFESACCHSQAYQDLYRPFRTRDLGWYAISVQLTANLRYVFPTRITMMNHSGPGKWRSLWYRVRYCQRCQLGG